MKARNLAEVIREVEKIKDKDENKIERKIKPLVIGLQRWGIKTFMSCQGA